mgnify:CR=1 FL=1
MPLRLQAGQSTLVAWRPGGKQDLGHERPTLYQQGHLLLHFYSFMILVVVCQSKLPLIAGKESNDSNGSNARSRQWNQTPSSWLVMNFDYFVPEKAVGSDKGSNIAASRQWEGKEESEENNKRGSRSRHRLVSYSYCHHNSHLRALPRNTTYKHAFHWNCDISMYSEKLLHF